MLRLRRLGCYRRLIFRTQSSIVDDDVRIQKNLKKLDQTQTFEGVKIGSKITLSLTGRESYYQNEPTIYLGEDHIITGGYSWFQLDLPPSMKKQSFKAFLNRVVEQIRQNPLSSTNLGFRFQNKRQIDIMLYECAKTKHLFLKYRGVHDILSFLRHNNKNIQLFYGNKSGLEPIIFSPCVVNPDVDYLPQAVHKSPILYRDDYYFIPGRFNVSHDNLNSFQYKVPITRLPGNYRTFYMEYFDFREKSCEFKTQKFIKDLEIISGRLPTSFLATIIATHCTQKDLRLILAFILLRKSKEQVHQTQSDSTNGIVDVMKIVNSRLGILFYHALKIYKNKKDLEFVIDAMLNYSETDWMVLSTRASSQTINEIIDLVSHFPEKSEKFMISITRGLGAHMFTHVTSSFIVNKLIEKSPLAAEIFVESAYRMFQNVHSYSCLTTLINNHQELTLQALLKGQYVDYLNIQSAKHANSDREIEQNYAVIDGIMKIKDMMDFKLGLDFLAL